MGWRVSGIDSDERVISQIADKELGKLTKIIERVWLVFPDEIANLIKDVEENEQE